jgi:hypothetical protein
MSDDTREEIKDKLDVPEPQDLQDEYASEVSNFDSLMQGITTVEHKLRVFWKLLFENAMTDRKNAYVAYIDLYIECHRKPDMHAIHGITLAKYLERMEKSNAQLLKLAELVQKAVDEEKNKNEEEEEEMPGARDIFTRIQNNKNLISKKK